MPVPVKNYDVYGAYRYYREDEAEGGKGLNHQQANLEIARSILPEWNRLNDGKFNLDAALQEFQPDKIVAELTGAAQVTKPGLVAEQFGRGVVESAPLAAGARVGAQVGARAPGLWKIPGVIVGSGVGSLAAGAADMFTGASDTVNSLTFGEEEDIAIADVPYAKGGRTAGLFLGFSGALRGALAKIPGGKVPTEDRGIIPTIKGVFAKDAPSLGARISRPVGVRPQAGPAVDFGSKALLENVGKATFKVRALRTLEDAVASAGTTARLPGQYYAREFPLALLGGAASGVAEKFDPGDALTEFGAVSLASLTPAGLIRWASVSPLKLAARMVRHPIQTPVNAFKNLTNWAEGHAKRKVGTQLAGIFERMQADFEKGGRDRLTGAEALLKELRENDVASEQLLPQLEAGLTARLTEAGFTPAQIKAAANSTLNSTKGSGYSPEIWSPDVNFDTFGPMAEAAFIRAVMESDPDVDKLTPGTMPGYANVEMMLVQAAQLSKNLGMRLDLETNTAQYLEKIVAILDESFENGLPPQILKMFAESQVEGNRQAIAATAQGYLGKITARLDELIAKEALTPDEANTIVLDTWQKWIDSGRAVERIGWKALPTNAEFDLTQTLKVLDDLSESSILGGRMEPGALSEIRDLLQLAGANISRPVAEINRLRTRFRRELTNIRATDKGLTEGSLETLLSGINGALKRMGLQEKFNLSDAVGLIFTPEDASTLINKAGLSEPGYSVPELINRFRRGALIGVTTPESVPEQVGYGVGLDLRSRMLDRLRDPNASASERRLLWQLQNAVLKDFERVALNTGNSKLTALTAYSRAFNDILKRSLAGRMTDAVENTDPKLLMENLLRGSPTRKGATIDSLIAGGELLERKETAALLTMAREQGLDDLVAEIEKLRPKQENELKTVMGAVDSYLRNLFVKGVVNPEAQVLKRLPADIRRLDPPLDIADVYQELIKPAALRRFMIQYGPAIENSPYLKTFFADLTNIEAAENALNAWTSNVGAVAERRANTRTLGTVLGVDSPVAMLDKIFGSAEGQTKFDEVLRVLKLMETSDNPVPSNLQGTLVPASEVHEEATKAFRQALFDWMQGQATDPRKARSNMVYGLNQNGVPELQKDTAPYIDVRKIYDLYEDTGNALRSYEVSPKAGWPQRGKNLGQTLVDSGVYTRESYDAFIDALRRGAEVQERFEFMVGNVGLAAAQTQKGAFGAPKTGNILSALVLRMFGGYAGRQVAGNVPMLGTSSLMAASMGRETMERFFRDMPNTFAVELFTDMFEPGNLKAFTRFLTEDVPVTPTMMQNFRQRLFERNLLTSPYLPVALEEYIREESQSGRGFGPGRGPISIPPPTSEVPPQPTAQLPPPPQPTAQMQPAVQPQPSPTSPAMRSQYAAAFPFDAASDIIRQQQARPPEPAQQGIGSLV